MFKKILTPLLVFSLSTPIVSTVVSCKVESKKEDIKLIDEDWADIDKEFEKMDQYNLNIKETFKKVFDKNGDLDKILHEKIIPNLVKNWTNKYVSEELNTKIELMNKIDFWIVFFDEEKDDTSSGSNGKNHATFISWISYRSKIDLDLINKNFFICFDKYTYFIEDGKGYVKSHRLNVRFTNND